MTNKELQRLLATYPDDLPIKIFDWKTNRDTDGGDGSYEGIHDFTVEKVDHWADWDKSEREFYMERHDEKPKPWIALAFDNPDLED